MTLLQATVGVSIDVQHSPDFGFFANCVKDAVKSCLGTAFKAKTSGASGSVGSIGKFALLRPLDFHYRQLVHLLAGFFICYQVVAPVSLFMQQVLWEEIISSNRVNTMCPLDIVVSFLY
jgi:hypothetical protein